MGTPIRIVFLGTPSFAIPSLKALVKNPAFQIDLVITQPDKPVGRKGIVTAPPVKIAAQKMGIPVWQPNDITAERMHRSLFPAHCDFLVAVAYGQILSEPLLDLPGIAPVNVHASLLPRWRGASPIQHAILAGDRETGISIQRMVKTLDTGPILAQKKTPIGPRETFPELHDRLSHMGAQLLVTTLSSKLAPELQPAMGITHCKKLTRASGIVDPKTMTAEEIDRRVRALNPWPGVTLHDPPLKILATDLAPSADVVSLACKHQTILYLRTVQAPGGKPMSGKAWERGKR